MREIIARTRPSPRRLWSRDRARDVFRDKGEMFKVELIDAIPQGEDLKSIKPGRLVRSVPRAAHAVDRAHRRCVQADEAGRRILAWRPEPAAAAAHLRHGVALEGGARPISTCWRRRRSATTVASAARWSFSICRRKRPARCSGIRRAGRSIAETAANYMRRRISKAVPRRSRPHRCSRPQALGELRTLGQVSRVDVLGRDRQQARSSREADELPRPRANLQPRAQVHRDLPIAWPRSTRPPL